MAANKENVNSRITVKSEKMLANRKEDDLGQNVREPLRTLSNQNRMVVEKEERKKQNVENLAGPSHSNQIDTRFVTYRSHNEELDWKFEVFKDNSRKNDTIDGRKETTEECTLQSRDEELPEQMEELLNTAASENINKTTNFRIDPAITEMYLVTPTLSFRTPSDVALKKVKKSLKRPQSKGAQDMCPLSAKLFNCSSHNELNESANQSNCIDGLNRVFAVDNLTYLLKIEKKVEDVPKVRSASRSCVINWIINVNGNSGCPLVIHLACWYLDSYLATTLVTVTRLQVIAAACFWLATKFHGRCITGRRLVRYSGNAFAEEELVATERNVLRKLKFEALSVTPYDFIPLLSWCCDASGTGVVEAAALFLCQCGLMIDKTLGKEYPSIIAAAAVKNAVILLRQNLWLKELKNCFVYKEAEAKARNLNGTCVQLRDAVRVVASAGYEYKAPLFKFSGPPFYIATKIVRAVYYRDIIQIDGKERVKRRTQ